MLPARVPHVEVMEKIVWFAPTASPSAFSDASDVRLAFLPPEVGVELLVDLELALAALLIDLRPEPPFSAGG